MKKLILSIAVMASAFISQSFTPAPAAEQTSLPVKESKVVWKAYKATGSHEGTIDVKASTLEFNEGKLTGGSVEIDMTTINCTDLTGEYKGKLEGHLKSDDFFSVAKHTTATLKITEVKSAGKNAYEVVGDMTIKGITHPITFQVSVYGKKATANLKVDRTKYDVKYGSGSFFENLQDKVIYDEFDLVVDLSF